MFRISIEGAALIKRFEGLRLEAYYDDVGVLTIGWGHTGSDVYEGLVITNAEAEALLLSDLKRFERGVNSAVNVPMTQSMYDALVSFSFNVGVSALKKSTALKRMNKQDYEGAAEALTWWNKGRVGGELVVLRGLQIRRAAEAALFLRDLDELDDRPATSSMSNGEVVENPPRRSNPITTRTTGGAATSGAAGATGAGAVLLDDEAPETEPAPAPATETTPETEPEPAPETDAPAPEESGPEESGPEESDEGAPPDAPPEEPTEATTEATSETVEAPSATAEPEAITKQDQTDAIVVAAGVLAVLAALYVIAARIDDWFKYHR